MSYNFIKNLRAGGIAVLMGALLLCSGCSKEAKPLPEKGQTAGENEAVEEQSAPQTPQVPQTRPQTPQASPDEQSPAGAEFSFANVADLEFYFSSGAGGWRTVLHIHADGSFDGVFSDSDMGDLADDYPNGTVYYSEFSGAFTMPEPVDETTWRFRIEQLEYVHEFGEEIIEGVRYVYSEAYGLAGAEELHMYLPGAKIAALPEGYRNWVGYYNTESMEETALPFYGLYNVTDENGFSSYGILSPADQIRDMVSVTEAIVEELEAQLQEAYTQADMNMLSGEIYQAWDNTLNSIWSILKEELNEEAMQALTAEQLDWIAEKEAAAAAAGAEVEGGSMYPAVVNGEAARWTKERVYLLAEYLQ